MHADEDDHPQTRNGATAHFHHPQHDLLYDGQPLSVQQSVTVNDVLYLVTLSVPSPSSSLSVLLLCPSTAQTHSNSFSAAYLASLTAKAHHPLSFSAFVSLLLSALSTPSSAASLDVLSSSDIRLLRHRHADAHSSTPSIARLSSSTGSSAYTSSASADDSKRYLILTHPADDGRLVHYPLPLLHGADPVGARPGDGEGGRTGLSVLTEVIAQLSAALKEARREVRAEREKRKAREREEKDEREATRAEIDALKRRMRERDERDERREQDRGEVDAMRQQWKKEETLRKAREDDVARWSARCERAEAELHALRLSRPTSSSGGSGGSGRRGRERERPAVRPNTARLVSSRSASPSYLRPTTSTQAKQSVSPARSSFLRASSPRLSASSSAVLPRPRSRSRSPAPLWAGRPRSPATTTGSVQRTRLEPAVWLLEKKAREEHRAAGPPLHAPPSHRRVGSPSATRERHSTSLSHHPPASTHSPSSSHRRLPTDSWRSTEGKDGYQHEPASNQHGSDDEERKETVRVNDARSAPSVDRDAFEGVRPSRAADVHSRLSALQTFLRAEKEKIAALARSH